jgi:hypothetical protein
MFDFNTDKIQKCRTGNLERIKTSVDKDSIIPVWWI